MAKFTIEITDTNHLKGITSAREVKNNSLTPIYKNNKELTLDQHPEYLKTDQDYVQFVMSSAAESYAKQHKV